MAKMHITVIDSKDVIIANHVLDIPEELPGATLGENLAQTVETVWRRGNDPTRLTFMVRFS